MDALTTGDFLLHEACMGKESVEIDIPYHNGTAKIRVTMPTSIQGFVDKFGEAWVLHQLANALGKKAVDRARRSH